MTHKTAEMDQGIEVCLGRCAKACRRCEASCRDMAGVAA